MSYTAVPIPTSAVAKNSFLKHHNHPCYSGETKLIKRRPIGTFPLKLSRSTSARSFLFDPETSIGIDKWEEMSGEWIELLLEIGTFWKNKEDEEDQSNDSDCNSDGEKRHDRESFSKLLVQVPLSDTKQYSKLAFLCNIAYQIQQTKAEGLTRYYGLEFVTSSLESSGTPELDQKCLVDPYNAYEVAASYVQSQARELLSLGSQTAEAAMVALVSAIAGNKAATHLHSLPYQWFSCDDNATSTRFFVIQGSESLAQWQVNLFFEPVNFEGTEALVHRGIYEAAIGLYDQFMPHILDHVNAHGDRAKLQFTGHCFGGSLAVLLNLMLLTRKMVNPSTLCPVVTFGSPFVLYGGENILSELELDENHVQSVIMHRDIVPRAFSCTYPDHISTFLENIMPLHSHPHLIESKLLYSPMGKVLILHPNEKSSPAHPLLPPGSALYALEESQCGSLASGLKEFLNNPHPIDTISDPVAYGSEGTIIVDHDSSSYLKAVNGILRRHTRRIVSKTSMWPLLDSVPPPENNFDP